MAEAGFAPLDGLVQEGCGLYLAPVRHHSPACAWAVRAMIEEVRPATVLVEAPVDFEPLIPALLASGTRPPVAIASLLDRAGDPEARVGAYMPFCAHSPELVALRAGHAVGAEPGFMDLPLPRMKRLLDAPGGKIVPVGSEHPFDGGDYVAALARRAGCRDGFELWDHLFESRLGTADWRGFFQDVGTYCAGLRAATAPERIEADGDAAREAHMAAAIRKALERGPVVVVAGGFHVPALVDPWATPRAAPPSAHGTARSYLVRYGFEAMDALSGNAAGLPQPAYYQSLWETALAAGGPPDWERTALDLLAGFADRMRGKGHMVSVPAQVETLRMAATLARLKGRPGAMRHDLIDAVRTVMAKGEAGQGDVWTEGLLSFLRGSALGEVPPEAGSPPLIEDARRRAAALRFDLSDGTRRRRRLDIRRKKSHLAASRFLHAMALLESGFAVREAGPDFMAGARTDLLFEEWSYAWSPNVEGQLLAAALQGDDVPGACLARLDGLCREMARDGRGRDLDGLMTIFMRGLLAGLGTRLAPFVLALGGEIARHGDFTSVARCLRRLQRLTLSRSPLSIPASLDISGLRDAAYGRLVYLCDDLPRTPQDRIADRVAALRIVLETLRGPGGDALDPDLFDEAMDRVADAAPPPDILGAILAICVQSSRRTTAQLAGAIDGNFHGSLPMLEDRIGVLRGMLATAPSLLWTSNAILSVVDGFLCGLDGDVFVRLLPHLRLALADLDPRETDRLARLLSERHGGSDRRYTASAGVSERDLARGAAADLAMAGAIEADGLRDWVCGHG